MSALTKILIVLMLVCSLVCSVVLMVGVSRYEPLKTDNDKLRTGLEAAQAANQKTGNDLVAAQAQIARLMQDTTNNEAKWKTMYEKEKTDRQNAEIQRDDFKAKIETANNQVSQLTAANESQSKTVAALQAEVQQLAPENVRLTTQNAELSRANNQAVTQLRFADQEIRKLQEALAAAETKGGAAAPAESGAVASLTVQTPVQINGKITDVTPSAGRMLVEMKLGARDGVRVGTVFVVSRDSKYIGDVTVDKVTPDASVATTSLVAPGETVKAGDIVTSGSPR